MSTVPCEHIIPSINDTKKYVTKVLQKQCNRENNCPPLLFIIRKGNVEKLFPQILGAGYPVLVEEPTANSL